MSKKKRIWKRLFIGLLCLALVGGITVLGINGHVKKSTADQILSPEEAAALTDVDCILVLGCSTPQFHPLPMSPPTAIAYNGQVTSRATAKRFIGNWKTRSMRARRLPCPTSSATSAAILEILIPISTSAGCSTALCPPSCASMPAVLTVPLGSRERPPRIFPASTSVCATASCPCIIAWHGIITIPAYPS